MTNGFASARSKFSSSLVLLNKLGISVSDYPNHWDPACWPGMRARLRKIFQSQTQAHWCELLENSDACSRRCCQ